MRSVSTALVGAGLLLLGACGGGADEANVADNGVDTLTIDEEDVLAPTDNGLGPVPDTTPAEANALDNAIDANLPDEPLEVSNESLNGQ